jgi:hypothetical protein
LATSSSLRPCGRVPLAGHEREAKLPSLRLYPLSPLVKEL